MSERQTVRWQNWAGNQVAEVDQILRPANEGDLVETVLEHVAQGHKIGAAGSTHSFSADSSPPTTSSSIQKA